MRFLGAIIFLAVYIIFVFKNITKMSLQLYEELNIPEYLDGRYFDLVMKSLDKYILAPEPLFIRVVPSGEFYTNKDAFADLFTMTAEKMYVRIILQKDDEDGNPIMRHSQLLIVEGDTVTHVEPNIELKDQKHAHRVSQKVVDDLFPDHAVGYKSLVQSNGRPISGGYCTAFVLKYAYFDYLEEEVTDWSLEDIRKFSRAVELIYGPIIGGIPEIEFGHNDTDTVVGGLAGAGLGLAVGGPVGALVGGAGGAYLGSRT